MDKSYRIEISPRTILLVIFSLLAFRVLWILRELLFSLFIAFMIMSITKPAVDALAKKGFPRTLSASLLLIVIFSLVGFGIYSILPPLILDSSALLKNLSLLSVNLDPNSAQYLNEQSLSRYLPDVTTKIFPIIRNVFSDIVFVITTIFFSFYLIIEENFLKGFLQKFFKERDAAKVARIFEKTEKRLGTWFRGELILMIVIGVFTYIGLNLIGIKHALSLAVIAGLLEAFPVIGPIMAAVPAFIFAVNQSFFLGLSVIALYVIIQQLENNLLVPIVMKRAIGLNKILILIVLIIGGKLAGLVGLFVAIPLTLCIESILLEL